MKSIPVFFGTILVCCLSFCSQSLAQVAEKKQKDNPSIKQRQQEVKLALKDQDGKEFSIRFLKYVPKKHDRKKKLPLILFLHGAGERGEDLNRVKFWGPPKLIEKGQDFPAIVLSPQCPKNSWWKASQLKAMLDHQVKELNIDRDRIYVTGLSMGGYGTWKLLAGYPEFFAAAIPICGGGNPEKASKFCKVPIWVFLGDADRVVPFSASEKMVKALKDAGGKPKFTVLKKVGHNSWSAAYGNPKTFKWLLKQKRKPKTAK